MADSPVDELMRALEDISRRAETASRGGWRSWAIGRANKALNRFNAERGDGVWVPREPTEAMLKASWDQTAAATPAERMANELCDTKTAHMHKMRRRYRAMIAAINPEGNDERA